MVTLMLISYGGEDTDGVERVVKRGGEVRVDGEVEKVEDRGDDRDGGRLARVSGDAGAAVAAGKHR